PDVLFMAVVNEKGIIVADSDPSKINTPFRKNKNLIHLGADTQENWDLVDLGNGGKAFEVHRYFRPLLPGGKGGLGRMQNMMRRHGMLNPSEDDWFTRTNGQKLIIVVGLDIAPFDDAIQADIRTTVVLSVILLVSGFGAFVSLFWMQSYRTAKRSLQDTSAFADEVVDHLPVGLIATDRDGRITFFNDAAGKITGVQTDQAVGKEPDTLLPAHLCGLRQSLDQGRVIADEEMECCFDENRPLPLSVSATRIINENGDFVGQVMILRDLREVRRLQAQIRRQEKLAAIGGLAAGVAHEIRNPLSSIKGLATYFKEQFADGSEARSAAGVMIQEVDRLNRTISELLDFARPTDLKRQSMDLAPLLSRSIHLIQQDASGQGIHIDLHLAEGLCPVYIDPDRLNQCLLNIYLNAIQAMAPGGTLTLRCENDSDRQVRIDISDTGQGIPPDQITKIFDPYFTTKNKGTGLGLAIVHKIVEAHQGRIEVQSTPGQGTTVTLQLPCDPDSLTRGRHEREKSGQTADRG
ncbi:MAG: ATP-binding protein, partial [Desulfosarcinaceae bacterium]